jgi:hypothetical protein
MQDPVQERLQSLCNEAASEQDPHKLIELVREINRLFDEKSNRVVKTADRAETGTKQFGPVCLHCAAEQRSHVLSVPLRVP